MPELSQTTSSLILFFSQVIAVYIVISISLYNLNQSTENKDLWISLLSSSVGYLLLSPILNKHASGAAE